MTSDDFLTNRAWHQAIVGGKDIILRHTSALEFLELFSGYLRERSIDVYALQPIEANNLNYRIIDSFDDIDYLRIGDVLCTSISQTFNDMLGSFDSIDEQSLIEGLSRYYYTHGSSFDSLNIHPENIDRFNLIKDWAIEYYIGA